jgi:cbb3-type cytochrome oxidase maturation protein
MSMVFLLIPLSLVLVGLAVWAFLWAVNSGQFDDLDTPAWEILTEAKSDSTAPESDAAGPLASRDSP